VGILTGPAGVGKTRLTIQLATALKASWVTGRLRPGAVGVVRAVIDCAEPTLVVIEANGWRPEIAAVLDDLAELDAAHQHGVKLLLVSRHRDWLTYLRSQVRADTAALIDAAKPLPLEPVGGPDDLLRWYRETIVTFTDLLGRPKPQTIDGVPTGSTFGDLLSLAYASVVTSNTCPALSTAAEVAGVLAEEERRHWPGPDIGIPSELRKRIVAALILRGGADDAEQAATVITQIPELSDASRERVRDLTRWAGQVDPGHSWFTMPPLELLTHGLAIPLLRDAALRKSLTSDLDILEVARVGSFLIGAANTYPEAEAWVTELLQPSDLTEGLAGLMFGSAGVPAPPQDRMDRLLAALIPGIRERTTLDGLEPVLSDGIGYPRARVALFRALAAAVRASISDDKPPAHRADLAAALIDLATALHDFGQHDESREASHEAITLLRKLADERLDSPERALARALTDLADVHVHLGQYTDALDAAKEAITLLRKSTEKQSEGHNPDLAKALRNFGQALTEVGSYAEALTAHQEAVMHLQKFDDENHIGQLDLAQAMTDLGAALRNVGQYAEALTMQREAVTLLRKLADEQPARYQPSLARALNNLGSTFHSVGQPDDDAHSYDQALAAHREAVTLLRQLAEEQPARYHRNLAGTLANLGGVLGEVGLHAEGLAVTKDAVVYLRKLTDEQPQHQRDLARALTNLGAIVFKSVGQYADDSCRYEKALAAEQEAVTLLRKLAAKQPARHLPELADALINLGGILHSVGSHNNDVRWYDEALAVDQEAIGLLRKLAAQYPARHQPDLARALSSLGRVLRRLGQYEEALAAHKESLALFKAVAIGQPWHRGDVAKQDGMIRRLLRDLGRDDV
jgi:tetratricopeptide (TPR) repeat protein